MTRTGRAEVTREKSVRPKVWRPPSTLDAPPAPEGFVHRWIRYETNGFDDRKNMSVTPSPFAPKSLTFTVSANLSFRLLEVVDPVEITGK